MLEMIHIENFVLAKNITIDIKNGFNVFSGETGAGKTLIINAIRYGMGEAFNKELFGGNTYPHVQLFFNLSHISNRELFNEFLEPSESEALCERWMTETGKSRVKINGKFFSIPQYQSFCKFLVNIHGQNSLDDLLSRKKQIFLFDSYFKNEINPLLDNFSKKRKLYLDTIHDLEKINSENTKREREIDFISYQIKEIQSASLKPGEMEDIKKERDLLSNSQKIISTLKNASDLLECELRNNGENLVNTFNNVTNLISHIKEFSPNLANIYKIASDCESVIKDLVRDIANESTQLESRYEEKHLTDLINRIDQIGHLQKKYGPTEDDILLYQKKLEEELQTLVSTEQTRDEKLLIFQEVEKYLIHQVQNISQTRKNLQPLFEQKINQELKDLSMDQACFNVEFSLEQDETEFGIPFSAQKVKLFENGVDRIEFKISTNPGQPKLPISQIASGGELSRIMLAIKTIIGTQDSMQTLIFDEIDSGIGGNTGNAVGKKLKSLGQNQQIICITHLPQIASKADNHFHIEKISDKESTLITIKKLSQEDRIQEISRMLDGNLKSTTSLSHAKEMMNI